MLCHVVPKCKKGHWLQSNSAPYIIRHESCKGRAEIEQHLSSICPSYEESSFSSKCRDFNIVNLLYSFALLARLCTCYPSLRCAENVQKCAEPKSARQNRLFRTAPKAGFQRYLLCKIFQFYPNNNLTWHTGSMAGFRTSEQTPFYSNSTFECNSNIVELHIAEMPSWCCANFLTCDQNEVR